MAGQENSFEREVDALRALRDELRVQLNLAGKEARDLFESAEKSWKTLEGRLRRVERESLKEARTLAGEIRASYQRLRDLL
jgi:hypothetical protein